MQMHWLYTLEKILHVSHLNKVMSKFNFFTCLCYHVALALTSKGLSLKALLFIFCAVVSTLFNFVRMFLRAHEDNCKQLEFEKKKALKEAAENERMKLAAKKESEHMIRTPIESGNIK